MRTNPFQGTGVAVVTPFTAEGEVDLLTLREHINRLLEDGDVDYLCVLGTTAETPTLNVAEREQIIEAFVDEVQGRVPLLLGCGGNDTGSVCAFLEEADFEGIDGVLIVTPYYNKPTQEGLYRHYRAVSQASPVPVVLYNVPGRTGVNLSSETTLRLAEDFENIVAIKEASGNLAQINEIISHAPAGFEVISGDDSLTFEIVALGGVGVISVVANAFPNEMAELVRSMKNGDVFEALHIHRAFHDIFRLAFVEGKPAGVKCMMAERKELQNVLRLPLTEVSENTRRHIAQALQDFEI